MGETLCVRRVGGAGIRPSGRCGLRSPLATRVLATVAALLPMWLAGCGQLEPTKPAEPITDPAQLYVRLGLNHAAVNLTSDTAAPAANTLQLTAVPYDGNGEPITTAPAPTFTSSDTSAVTVSAGGLLRAHRYATGVKVIAALTIGTVRHVDTALVNVQDLTPAPVLDTFSIHVPPANAVWYMYGDFLVSVVDYYSGLITQNPEPPIKLLPRVVDASGHPISTAGLAIEYASLDSTVAAVDRRSGAVTPLMDGYARVVARTVAYGVAKADTMTYTVQRAYAGFMNIDRNGFYIVRNIRSGTPTRTIVAGGIVVWYSYTAQPMDVTFDDPTSVTTPPAPFCDLLTDPFGLGFPPGPYCGAGDIAAFSGDSLHILAVGGVRFRQFPVPGVYPFHSTTTGATGQVVVIAPRPLP